MLTRNGAVRVSPSDPCPFCGCGLPMNAAEHKARPRRIRATVVMGRHADGTPVSRVGPVSDLRTLTERELADIAEQTATVRDRTGRGYRLVARKSRGQWQAPHWELDPLNVDAQVAA